MIGVIFEERLCNRVMCDTDVEVTSRNWHMPVEVRKPIVERDFVDTNIVSLGR